MKQRVKAIQHIHGASSTLLVTLRASSSRGHNKTSLLLLGLPSCHTAVAQLLACAVVCAMSVTKDTSDTLDMTSAAEAVTYALLSLIDLVASGSLSIARALASTRPGRPPLYTTPRCRTLYSVQVILSALYVSA